jgi:hypothetical protein
MAKRLLLALAFALAISSSQRILAQQFSGDAYTQPGPAYYCYGTYNYSGHSVRIVVTIYHYGAGGGVWTVDSGYSQDSANAYNLAYPPTGAGWVSCAIDLYADGEKNTTIVFGQTPWPPA